MSALPFPTIDPVIFSIPAIFGLGPLYIRWYGLMYVLGFTMSYLLVQWQIRRRNDQRLGEHFENLNMVLILSVIVGGRLGYVLFYNFSYYMANPLEIPATWSGGMSFHGACLTLLVTGWIYCRLYKLNFWKSGDIYIITIPIGLGLGRIGNFINAELYGRVTDLPMGMIFPGAGPLPRHPSQLYEALLEGFVLFTVLWLLKNKPYQNKPLWPHGSMMALFLGLYGFFRFLIEFAREPDQQIGFLFGNLTMGQLLSSLMIAGGATLWLVRKKRVSSRHSP